MRRNPTEIKWTSKLAYVVGIITTDGNLSKDNRHVTLTSVDTQWLRKEIQKLIHIKGNMSNQTWKRRKKSTMYRLKFSTKQAKIILNWIYYKPNLPCLLRKYLIAKPFLRN